MMMMSGSRGRLEMLVKNRLMSFLIWQSISSSIVFLHFLCLPLSSPHYPFFSFIVFLSSHLLFSPTLSFLSSPHPRPRLPLSLLFATAAAFSAALSLPAAAHPSSPLPRLAFRGFLIGSLFASHYLFQRRWLLHFPIIQVSHLFPLINKFILFIRTDFLLLVGAASSLFQLQDGCSFRCSTSLQAFRSCFLYLRCFVGASAASV